MGSCHVLGFPGSFVFAARQIKMIALCVWGDHLLNLAQLLAVYVFSSWGVRAVAEVMCKLQSHRHFMFVRVRVRVRFVFVFVFVFGGRGVMLFVVRVRVRD